MVDVFHLGLSRPQLMGATVAILPGDPGRVERIGSMMERPRALAGQREFVSWLGYLDGRPVVVCSTGIGGPSTSIAVEELAQLGIRTFLRAGTTGAIQPNRVGPSDGFLARFDASLTGPSHATYLGGNGNNGISDHDELAGVLYVGGSVEIDDFPGTAGGAQESYAGGDYDGFLAALTSDLVQLPTVSVDDVAGLEGNSGTTPWVFTVSLSAAPESPATVTVATAAGTASSGVDFAPLGPLVLTFLPAGPTTQTVTVQIQGDPGVEPDETFSLVLSLPTGLELGDAAGTGTILNDDQSVVEIPTLSPAGLAGLALALAATALARVRRGNH